MSRKLKIPFAKNPDGVFITPVSWNTEDKIICHYCDENLICKRGKKYQWHFSHYSKSSCSGGGESSEHKAAKLILSQYMSLFSFEKLCPSEKHQKIYNSSTKYVTEIEYNIPGTQMIADVAILTREGVLKGIVEVKYTKKTSEESLESRELYAPCVEVRAEDVLDIQNIIDLYKVNREKIIIRCINRGRTKQCDILCDHPEYTVEHEKTLCAQCQTLGEGYVPTHGKYVCPKCCIACPNCDGPMLKMHAICGGCYLYNKCQRQEEVYKQRQKEVKQEEVERLRRRDLELEREKILMGRKRKKYQKEYEIKYKRRTKEEEEIQLQRDKLQINIDELVEIQNAERRKKSEIESEIEAKRVEKLVKKFKRRMLN